MATNKITIELSPREYKKYLQYKEVDKIVRGVKRGLKEVKAAQEGKIKLKSAYDLIFDDDIKALIGIAKGVEQDRKNDERLDYLLSK